MDIPTIVPVAQNTAEVPAGNLVELFVRDLAWPVTAIVLALVFRGSISDVLKRLKELGYGEFKAAFSEGIADLGREAARLPEVPIEARALEDASVAGTSLQASEFVREWVKDSPTAAILSAWAGVERALAQAYARLSPADAAPIRDVRRFSAFLFRNRYIDEATLDVLDRLRELRNELAHGAKPGDAVSAVDAAEYIRTASKIERLLNAITARLPRKEP